MLLVFFDHETRFIVELKTLPKIWGKRTAYLSSQDRRTGIFFQNIAQYLDISFLRPTWTVWRFTLWVCGSYEFASQLLCGEVVLRCFRASNNVFSRVLEM